MEPQKPEPLRSSPELSPKPAQLPCQQPPTSAAQESSQLRTIRDLRNRIEAVLWVSAALSTAYFGNGEEDMIHVVIHDSRIKRPWLYFGLAMMSINLGIFLYLSVWLNCIRGVTEEWEDAAPLAVPVGTCAAVASGFSFIVALWPVWTYLTPAMLFVLLMGFIMSGHFWPSLGSKASKPSLVARVRDNIKTL
mmetsp:Transcript_36008/g.101967  ORF Transcript_36008/g.101967 Transcript_36008/m.101967 type:complete len:192 (-) Transcript_36008:90-665(-)